MTPTCKFCGKKLVKHFIGVDCSGTEPLKVGDMVSPYKGSEPMEIIEVSTASLNEWIRHRQNPQPLYNYIRCWFGDWGAYGCDHFCSKTCGYRWALKQLRGRNV